MDPAQWRELRLGFDTHTRLLETVVVVASDGDELLIHVMKARPHYAQLLEYRHPGSRRSGTATNTSSPPDHQP